MIRVGVIGCGYWGPKLVRNFSDVPGARVTTICDLDRDRLADVRARYPWVRATTRANELIGATDVDAVVVATPVSSHYDLASRALAAGKHVLVEKPLATSAVQAERLVEEAARRRLVLLVDHTFVYTGAVRKIRDLLAGEGVGEVLYYDSVRIDLGPYRHDVNVLWDLAAHDLSILDYLLGAQPRAVSATGARHLAGGTETVAYITLFFDDSLIAHVHANWLAPVKVRSLLIGGREKMIVYNDLEPIEKVRVYDKGIVVNDDPDSVYQMRVGYRTGDMWAPRVDPTEALRTEAAHFLRCVSDGEPPMSGGDAGLRVVRILEATSQSLAAHGGPVVLAAGTVA